MINGLLCGLLTSIMLLVASPKANASHLYGMDLSYRWLRDSTYQITLTAFGDCAPSGASSFATLPSAAPLICIFNGGTYLTSISLAIQAPTAGVEVTPVCDADTANTQCHSTTSTLPGVKKFVYTGTYTIPSRSRNWRFLFNGNMGSAAGAGRTASITNITTGSVISLVDTLDNTTYTNSSPSLPVIPTPYYYLNHSCSYNPGGSDPDGDSLSFKLVNVASGGTGTSCTAGGGTITYQSGTSGAAPLLVSTPITFNTHSGQIDFIPNALQRADIVYNIAEYRSGVKVGTSQREMTFLVVTDPTGAAYGAIDSVVGLTQIDSTDVGGCYNSGAFSFLIKPRAYDTTWNVIVTTTGVPSFCTMSIVNNNTTHPTIYITGNNTAVATGTYPFYFTYTDNGCPISQTQTVAYSIQVVAPPVVAPIVGQDTLCVGSNATYTDTATMGTWSSVYTSIATISTAGVATGLGVGIDTIKYTETNVCATTVATKAIVVRSSTGAGTIVGASNVCTGSTSAYTDTVAGGVWSVTNTSFATVNPSTGVVTGVASGVDTLKYTVTSSCGTAVVTKVLTITTSPTAGTITGPTRVCTGSSISLSNTTTGGTWSHTNTTAATITGGLTLIGLAAGVDTVKYTISASCGTVVATHIDTVILTPNAGTITGTSTICQTATTTLSSSGTTGGTWSSDSTTIATVTAAGLVTGVRGGVDTIRYTVSNACGTSSAAFAITITSLPAPAAISGAASLCPGDTSTFTDPTPGGTWSSTNTSVATVNSSTGLVTGVALGTTNISYTVTGSCGAVSVGEALAVNAAASAGTITGSPTVCPGSTTTLTDPVTGGIWSSTNTSVATVNSSGVVTGVAPGVDTIKYTAIQTCGTAVSRFVITVPLSTPIVGAITGTDSVCVGSTITLSDTSVTGSWSSVFTAIATVNASGVVTGVAGGVDTIKYTINNGCGTAIARKTVKVNPLPSAGVISGTLSVCPGANTALSESVSGGVWSSANAAIATVSTTGSVHGVASGRVIISYTVTNSCGSHTDTAGVVVNTLATVGTISGTTSLCQSQVTTLTNPTPGGTWSSGNTDVAIVSATGVVTSVFAGTTKIYYSVTNVCNTATDSVTFTTLPNPDAGNISGTPILCPGTSATVTPSVSGGTWSSFNTSIATVNSAGLVTGVAAGTDSIFYSVTNACGTAKTYIIATVNPVPVGGVVSGADSVCQSANTTFTSTGTTGGTWASSNTAIATVDASGVVYGVGTGSVNITYNITNSCGTASSNKSIFVKPLPSTGSISGASTICPTGSTILSDAVSGGTWSSSNTSVATINTTGTVTAVGSGSTTISYSLTNACGTSAATLAFTVSNPPSAGVITGSPTVCTGSSITLSDTVSGGTWSVSNSNGTINSAGLFGGLSNGLDTVTYTVTTSCGTSSTTFVVTVGAPTSAGTITGPNTVLIGNTITLSNTTTGGTWSSRNTLIATVGSTTGVVGGVSNGTTLITYSLASSCGTAIATYSVTVCPAPNAGAISGSTTVCLGSPVTLTESVSGGTWVVTNGNATISATGTVTAVVTGTTDTVLYIVSNACASDTARQVETISTTPDAGAISGVTTICQSATASLTETVSGGTWSSSNTAVATVNSVSGSVTGTGGGSVNITYTVTNACGSATNVFPMTVTATPNGGTISGPSIVCIGSSITLTDATTGGTWSSTNTAVATVDATGNVTGVGTGATTISYTVTNSCGTAAATATVNVFTAPNAGTLSGATVICIGGTSTLSSTSAGGTWSSTTTSVATVGSASGLVGGVAAGTSLISYTVTTGCGSATDTTTVTVNATATGGTISGPSNVCIGSTATLTDPVAGGTWSSGTPSVATISSTGDVTGVATGSTIITYTVSSICGTASATYTVNVSPAPNAGTISGSSPLCQGSTATFTDAASGGTWSSSDVTVATVGATGTVGGVAGGSVTISYSVTTACSTAVATFPLTVNPLPVAGTISGASAVCIGLTTTLTETATGGTWSSTNTAAATVDAGGVVTGVGAGSTTISYTVTNSCGTVAATKAITVSAAPNAGAISGTTTVCAGLTSTLSETVSGGAWTSGSTAVATVNASGVVTAVSGGTTTISYTVATACSTAVATTSFLVNPLPNAGSISGSGSICVGANTTLTPSVSGGSWSTSDATVASVNASGTVTGVGGGSATISYSVTNSCGTANATFAITVGTGPSAGTISGASSICTGTASSYTETVSGGTWSSSNPSVASVSSTGTVSAFSAGSVTLSYSVSASCGSSVATLPITVLLTPSTVAAISGPSSLCVGTSGTYSDATTGGTWSSSNTSVATINSSTGIANGTGAGSAVITYSITNTCGSAQATTSVTVSPLATSGTITGTTTFCAGTSNTFTETVSGGTWSSSNTAVATVSPSGVVTGVSGGSATISYSISGSCGSAFAVAPVTILPAPDAGTISGASAVCVGSTIALTETSSTGTWSSTNTAVATVSGSGVVTGVGIGTATISYTATNSCGTVAATRTITVDIAAFAGSISGASTVCQGASTTFTAGTPGGTWSTSSASIATVNTSGIVTGVAGGSVTVSYTVTTGCSSASATSSLTVNPLPSAGTIGGRSTACIGASYTFTETVSGGTWSTSAASVATVSPSGVVTGVAAGSATISYTTVNSCGSSTATFAVAVSAGRSAGTITGTPNVCIGATSTLADAVSGGVWSSSNPSAVSVSSSGVIYGVSNGTATISYSVASTCDTSVATISAASNPFPSAGTIVGPTNVCLGTPVTYVDTTAGGVWSSGTPSIATVSSTGVVTGLTTGTVNIYYSVTNACGATNVTVSVHVLAPTSVAAITGTTTVCPGATSTLSDATSGGSWSSSDSSIARMSSTGILTGVATGSATISYGVSTSCGMVYSTTTATVRSATNAGTISGAATLCAGATASMTETVSGGVWSSSNTSIATISTTGTVTGVAGGVDTIVYTVSGICGSASATKVINITPATTAGTIAGTSTVCVGLTTGLSSGVSGGTWSSSNTARATVSSTGVVSGVTTGAVTISYTVTGACGTAVATFPMTVSTTPDEGYITGTTILCAGSTTGLTESVTGGTWSSGATAIATVSSTGVVTGVAGGNVIISYTVTGACGTAVATAYMTVRPLPDAGSIAGTSTTCVGTTSALVDTFGGGAGAWTSSNTSVATVSASGVVTAVAAGTSTISYTLTNSCGSTSATLAFTVTSAPTSAGTITGPSSVCPGATIALSDAVSGGSWTSSNSSVAGVNSAGVVNGVAAGTATISYTITNACGTISTSTTITVNSSTTAGTISGPSAVCSGSSITLTDATTGGTWSSSDASIATVSTTGDVTGVAGGTVTISYTTTGICGTASATYAVTVTATPAPSAISGASTVCEGTTTTLTDALTGGTWTSSDASVAIVSTSGDVYGAGTGSATITYTVTSGACSASVTHAITVSPAPSAGSFSGATTTVCAGSAITLSSSVSGGTWTSGDASVATVSSTGAVTGVTAGATNISYSVTNSCGTATISVLVNVNPTPVAPSVSGATSMCVGSAVAMTTTGTGGAWSSSNTAVASVDASGNVYGVAGGTSSISYTVTNAFGCSASGIQMDTIVAPPTVAAISGTSHVCQYGTSTLSDATTGGSWSSSDVTLATISTTGVVTGVNPGAVTITYTVGASGCYSMVTFEDTVIAAPAAGSISGPSAVCAGSSITLTETLSTGSWYSGNVAVATVDAAGSVTGVAAGVDTIYYVVTGTYGCTSAASAIVTVNAIPTVATITGSSNACLGSSITLSDATAGGSWSSSVTTVATVSATGSVYGVALGATTITYSVTTSGCTGYATMAVTVRDLPTVSAITGASSVCAGATTTFVDTTAGGTWSTSDASIASVNTAGVVSGVAGGSATITYTVTNTYGCSAAATAGITVNTGGSVAAITGAGVLCAGSSITLNDATAGGTWSSSDTSIARVNASGVVTGGTAGIVTITYTVGASSGCPAFATHRDTVRDLAGTLVPATGFLEICHGNPVTMSVTTTATSFQWYRNTTAVAGATTSSYTSDSTGSFTVTISDAVCVRTLGTVAVLRNITPVVHQGGGDTLYVTGGVYFSYQWLREGGIIAGATNATYNYVMSGHYSVVVADGFGCADTSNVLPLGVVSVNNGMAITTYPNPATNVIVIDAPVKVNISIMNMEGKELIAQYGATSVDVTNLASGMYLIKIYDENNNLLKTDKFIKAD